MANLTGLLTLDSVANNLNLATNGTTRWTIDSSGSLSSVVTAGTINCTNTVNSIALVGGTTTAGAFLAATGTTHATPGRVDISGGSAAGGIFLATRSASDINFSTNNTSRWSITSAGHLIPSASSSYTIGGTANKAQIVWADAFLGNAANVSYGNQTTDTVTLQNSGSIRWRMQTTGHLTPETDGVYDMGSTSLRMNTLRSINFVGANGNGFWIRNNANNADINVLTMSGAANNVTLAAPGTLNVQNQGTDNATVLVFGGTNNTTGALLVLGGGSLAVQPGRVDLASGTAGGPIIINARGNADIQFYSNNTFRWAVVAAGSFLPGANNSYDIGSSGNRVATIYSVNALNTSDTRLKNNIVSLAPTDALAKVCALNPVNYKLIPEYDTSDRLRAGFLAQEAALQIPEAVVAGDTLTSYGDEDFESWSMQSDHIIPYLAAAIKKLNEIVEAQEARIAVLENQ